MTWYEYDSADEGEASPVVAATTQEVLELCREHAMEEPIRLSTLGNLLGPSAKAYLKGRGLKLRDFLEHYPEFVLEGSGAHMTVICKPGGRAKQGVPTTSPRQSGTKVTLNRYGYPSRPGQPDCDYYVKNRWCKYGDQCVYNHPEHAMASSSDEGSYCRFYMKNGWCEFGDACKYGHPERRTPSDSEEEEPALNEHGLLQRRGRGFCNFFMQTGWCKYRDACKYEHPERQMESDSEEEEEPALNERGLPQRRGKGLCKFYMQTGWCKYRDACKYDHPERQMESDSEEGSTNELDAYVFHAKRETIQDCWDYGVLAAPLGALKDMRRNIHKDTLLFVYVMARGAPWQLFGPFHALLDERLGCLEPDAFNGEYPAQVRIAPGEDLRTVQVDVPFRMRAPGRKTPEEVQAILDVLQAAGKKVPWEGRRRSQWRPREEPPASRPSSSSAGDEVPAPRHVRAALEPEPEQLQGVPAVVRPQACQVGTRVFSELAGIWELGTVVEADEDFVSVVWDAQDPRSTSRLPGASIIPVRPAGSNCEVGDRVFARFHGQWYPGCVLAHVRDEQQMEVRWDSEYSRSRLPCADVMPRLR